MQTRTRNTFTTIHTEGSLLPVDLLQRIRSNDASLDGLTPESYHLAPGEEINEAINRSWNRLNGLWGAFQTARGRLGPNDAGTTLTRERWLLPLFQELGFGRLSTSRAVEIEGKSYPISHSWQNVPLHLVGCGLELDKRTPGAAGAARTSPHSLLQEYLNRSEEAQWGLLSNGLGLRILRDNATLTRQAYVEFDLESMFDGEVYSDFVLLWLVCHQSRFETAEKQRECILERWSKNAQERGTRALDDLRRGVEEAIRSLGQGFLLHPLNGELCTRLKKGDLSAQDYYRQLLRLVYRLIFLFAAEDRDLLLLLDAPVKARQRYQNFYSTARLRALAERQRGSRHHDRYEAIRLVMTLLGSEKGCPELAIPALGGFLFDERSSADLNVAKLDNQSLLAAVRSLAFITEGNTRRAVDYRNLGPEELGSVYESLLELHPLLNIDAGTFLLTSAAGNERKTTGSYYTPTSLIKVLLDSALDPVISQAVQNAGPTVENQQSAILNLKVCDPACGSGHFLIAAAHRIARKLAEIRSSGDEPAPQDLAHALREVIRHCIYGVDINPMAVELCKVNLWLESLEPGKPLSFLDAHIKCGNSLVGVGPKIDLDDLEVPDEAFNPVTGDHKPTATLLKKRNKKEREGQESLFMTVIKTRENLDKWLAERSRTLETMPEDNAVEVQAKAEAYQQVNESAEYHKQQQVADLWTAAFYWKIEEAIGRNVEIVAPTHGQLHHLRNGSATQTGLLEQTENLRQAVGFFHWPLEFAEVTAQGGFDCVLGNPPWERPEFHDEKHWADDLYISEALSVAIRAERINEYRLSKDRRIISRIKFYDDERHSSDSESKFVTISERFPLSGVGKYNYYAVFAEHAKALMGITGRNGIIIPTGIATDDTTKDYFGNLVKLHLIASLYDFENREKLFSTIDSRMRFSLLTVCQKSVTSSDFVFYATKVQHLLDINRRFNLSADEISLFNPNTHTMPIFRTRVDAELSRNIYERIPILENEASRKKSWNLQIKRIFNMGLPEVVGKAKTTENLLASGELVIGKKEFYDINNNKWLPVYEGKMFNLFNHRSANVEFHPKNQVRPVQSVVSSTEQLTNPNFIPTSGYWMPYTELERSKPIAFANNWLVAYKDITASTNDRTLIATILPHSSSNFTVRCVFIEYSQMHLAPSLLANLNSLVLDYLVRQSLGGLHLSDYIIKQLPILPPTTYTLSDIAFINQRVLELVYTAYDLKLFAEDMGYHGEPFRWDEERRALLRAELDAYYARLYGLTRDELRYILDPQDVYGPDFPGETFRVLKEKEIRQFGEYRTRRLVLKAWDRLEGLEIGNPEGYRAQEAQAIPPQEIITIAPQKEENRPAVVPAKSKEPTPEPPARPEEQPALADFGLYKCAVCGKMVLGFDKENHEREKHGGKSVEWKKMR